MRADEDGVIRVSRRHAARLARLAARPWDGVAGSAIPDIDKLAAVIMRGIKPGEVIKSGSQRWTYLGVAELLHQVYADGMLPDGSHPLLHQRTHTPSDRLINSLLIYKAQATIPRGGGSIWTNAIGRR